ncbi:hypothetical protein K438DRAFT_1979043 [Mycena galopus ATCC 62051]|nr:hypothetical protein K438DRAFT_1979043 [Mycena galopus ATCC 62051]
MALTLRKADAAAAMSSERRLSRFCLAPTSPHPIGLLVLFGYITYPHTSPPRARLARRAAYRTTGQLQKVTRGELPRVKVLETERVVARRTKMHVLYAARPAGHCVALVHPQPPPMAYTEPSNPSHKAVHEHVLGHPGPGLFISHRHSAPVPPPPLAARTTDWI